MPPSPTRIEKHRFDIGLEDLQTFLAVADLRSFSAAATHLNLSQPSVSNRVRRLEEKLLVRLLDRTTRQVELTAHGQRLYLQASETLFGLRNLLQDFGDETSSRTRQVNIAATLMVATFGLPPILRDFHDAHPTAILKLHDLTPAEAVEQVADGRCDMAIMVLAEPHAGISFEPLAADPCVVITQRGHRLLRHETATLAEVLEHTVLIPDTQTGFRQALIAEAEKRGLTIRLSPEARGVSNGMTLLAMAAAGLGVCIHPRSFIPAELEPTIGIARLGDCEIVRIVGIVTSDSRTLSSTARKFRDFVRASMIGGNR